LKKFSYTIFFILIMVSLSGCFVFKKGCDCPKFKIDIALPLSK